MNPLEEKEIPSGAPGTENVHKEDTQTSDDFRNQIVGLDEDLKTTKMMAMNATPI